MPQVEEVVGGVNDLQEGEMREVKVGDKKVLLSKISGQFFATGSVCTHYKAPLVTGVLAGDGRVVCPWHGACFNVKSGDIEDAPALDALAKYDVRIEDGKVIVSADQESLTSGRRVPVLAKADSTKDSRVFVILGGGAAGMGAVEGLREHGFQGRIILISKEPHLPIDRIKISKGLKTETEKILLRGPSFFDQNSIELLLGKEVVSVNPTAKTVKLNDSTEIAYDSLLIATGGNPRNFWPNAAPMNNVVVLRGVADSAKLDAAVALHPNARIVTVGSSFIALEIASCLTKQAKSITVIGMETVPFERVLGTKLGGVLQKLHEEKGVTFVMNAVVDTFESEDGGQSCSALKLKNGDVIPADIVIIGAGVAPATDNFKDVLPVEKDGSITVDQYLAVAGHNNIYAAGDIARYPYHLNAGIDHANVRIEHWNVAIQQGRLAAQNMIGKDRKPFQTVPFFWTSQYGKSVRYCGHGLKYDDVIIDGDVDNLTFAAYYVHGEAVVAVASLGRDPIVAQASELLRLGLMPSASELRAGKNILDIPTCGPGSITANQIKKNKEAAVVQAASSSSSATPVVSTPSAAVASSSGEAASASTAKPARTAAKKTGVGKISESGNNSNFGIIVVGGIVVAIVAVVFYYYF